MKKLQTVFLGFLFIWFLAAWPSNAQAEWINPDTGTTELQGSAPEGESAGEFVINPLKLIMNLIQAAIERGKEALEISGLKGILDGVVTLYKGFNQRFMEMYEAFTVNMAKKSAAQHLYAATEIEITQAEVDAATSNVFWKEGMNMVPQVLSPKNEYLCKKVLAHQATTTTQAFEREVSRMAAEAISDRYRCPTCDGRGPDYVGKEQARRCKQGYGNAIDGASLGCKASTASGKSLADADIAPIDGGQMYQMPKMETKAYVDSVTGASMTVSVPAPINEQQTLWVAAWDNIFLLAGPRPTPSHGKGMKTPAGKVQRAMFNHCVASENALIKQCTDLLAYYTRPNCAESGDLCAAQQKECLAATGFVDLEPYQNCGKNGNVSDWQGLSPYETQKINQDLCKSEQSSSNLLHGGAKYKDVLLDTVALCDLSDQALKEFVARKHENCRSATQGLQTLRSCWGAVGQ